MGRRARRAGIANAAVRTASKALAARAGERETLANAMAEAVRKEVREWPAWDGSVMMAGAVVSASMMAPAAAEAAGLTVSEESVSRVAAHLVRVMREAAEDLDVVAVAATEPDPA